MGKAPNERVMTSLTGSRGSLSYIPAEILKNVCGVRILERSSGKKSVSLERLCLETED